MWGPVAQSDITRRLFTRERLRRRRLTSGRNAHDALRRIRIIALNQRRRLSAQSGSSRALDEIIAIADAAIPSTGGQ